jgi:hypothetical protein
MAGAVGVDGEVGRISVALCAAWTAAQNIRRNTLRYSTLRAKEDSSA